MEVLPSHTKAIENVSAKVTSLTFKRVESKLDLNRNESFKSAEQSTEDDEFQPPLLRATSMLANVFRVPNNCPLDSFEANALSI